LGTSPELITAIDRLLHRHLLSLVALVLTVRLRPLAERLGRVGEGLAVAHVRRSSMLITPYAALP
jgi:hypothetical protein